MIRDSSYKDERVNNILSYISSNIPRRYQAGKGEMMKSKR
jgi:hypothetical protein